MVPFQGFPPNSEYLPCLYRISLSGLRNVSFNELETLACEMFVKADEMPCSTFIWCAFGLSVSVRTQKPSEIRNLICCILFSRVWWDGKKTDRRQNVSRCGDGERGTSPPPSGPPLPPPPVAQHKTGRTKYKGSSSCCHHGLAALLQDRQGGVVGVEGMHYFVHPLHIYLTYFGMHWLGSACCL